MNAAPFSILVLCTGNSARSILGEALFNALGQGRVRAFSAGSTPKGQPHPMALKVLTAAGLPTDGLSSKSWDVFAQPDAPPLDLIVTVCDNAAGETCPIWPGHPLTAHWGIPDPAAVTDPEEAVCTAFESAYAQMEARVKAFLALPFELGQPADLKPELARIGELP